jgi:outer membrane protein OmpA-like peptidoglycan-associated protein
MSLLRYLPLICCLIVAHSTVITAQQSSKSKSKDRFQEKDFFENAEAELINITAINTPQTEYSPAWYGRAIVFASSREKKGNINPKTGETYSQLYLSQFDPNDHPSVPFSFSLNLNSSLNEGPVTFSRDLRTIFYTQNNNKEGTQKSDQNGRVRLKIYEARKGPIDWVPIGELPFNSTDYSCIHPSLSADEGRLYFSSNMPGGIGGYDIYYSERQANGTWGTPVNAGPIVNTEKNELFPFIHATGMLFFSSTGHQKEGNLGGMDIFYTIKNRSGQWVCQPMKAPFNTPDDDLGLIVDDEFKHGFFSSNRKADAQGKLGSLGKDDIYEFYLKNGLSGAVPAAIRRKVTVTDARTKLPIQGAEIRLLKASRDGFVDGEESDVYDIEVAPIENGSNQLRLQLRSKAPSKIGKPDLYANAAGEAEADLLTYRSYVIMVSSPGFQTVQEFVTTEGGDDLNDINIKMGAASACYPVAGTVATDQLGTRIAAANIKFINKVTGHVQTATTNLNGEYEICLTVEGKYLVQIERKGFHPENYSLETSKERQMKETRMRPTELGGAAETEMPLANAVQNGSIIVLDRINFEPNKTALNQTAIRNLDALFELLVRYPNMKAEIAAHTDTRGNAANNLSLSFERADNARAYLMYRGIGEDRLIATGKGGTEPRNRCLTGVECSEEEHKANQRFEVKVRF